MSNNVTLARNLINKINTSDLIDEIINYSNRFYDEPTYFHYGSITSTRYTNKETSNYYYHNEQSIGIGVSTQSAHTALVKSIMESLERFSLRALPTDKIKIISPEILSKKKVNYLFPSILKDRKTNIGWIKGIQITPGREKEILIPAQLIFLEPYSAFINKYNLSKEPLLGPITSSGAAAHLHLDKSIEKGIYELIERDTTMSIYLNEIPAHPIQHDTIPFRSVKKIIKKCQRYKLEVYLFVLTTDNIIPVAMTILIDRTGLGPLLIVGSHSSNSLETSMLHSIEEAIVFRLGMRKEIMKSKKIFFDINPHEIVDTQSMQFFWHSPLRLKLLNFLINQRPIPFNTNWISPFSFRQLISYLHNNSHFIYYVDITPPQLKRLQIHVSRVIIPSLQPLYINQSQPYFNKPRLQKVSTFYNKKTFHINTIPHPIS